MEIQKQDVKFVQIEMKMLVLCCVNKWYKNEINDNITQ